MAEDEWKAGQVGAVMSEVLRDQDWPGVGQRAEPAPHPHPALTAAGAQKQEVTRKRDWTQEDVCCNGAESFKHPHPYLL